MQDVPESFFTAQFEPNGRENGKLHRIRLLDKFVSVRYDQKQRSLCKKDRLESLENDNFSCLLIVFLSGKEYNSEVTDQSVG